MNSMDFLTAEKVDIETASDGELAQAWDSYARKISFHFADDSGGEWGIARSLMARAREIERAIWCRGMDRPEGSYLLVLSDRINWATGEWSQNWPYAKVKEEAQ